jgi:hypothetical protein
MNIRSALHVCCYMRGEAAEPINDEANRRIFIIFRCESDIKRPLRVLFEYKLFVLQIRTALLTR